MRMVTKKESQSQETMGMMGTRETLMEILISKEGKGDKGDADGNLIFNCFFGIVGLGCCPI